MILLLQMGLGTIVISSIIVFLVVTLLLVAILLWARKKLMPQGKVKININDEKEIEVDPGNSLLSTLSTEKIFVPSACGGGGTCGMCRVQVLAEEEVPVGCAVCRCWMAAVPSCLPKRASLPVKNRCKTGGLPVR